MYGRKSPAYDDRKGDREKATAGVGKKTSIGEPAQTKYPFVDKKVVESPQKQRVGARSSPRRSSPRSPKTETPRTVAAVIYTDAQGRFLNASTSVGNPLDFVVLSSDRRRRTLPTSGVVPSNGLLESIASDPIAKKLFNEDQYAGAKAKLLVSGAVPKDRIESRLSVTGCAGLNGRFLSPAHAVASGIWDFDDCHDECHHHHHRDCTEDHHSCHSSDHAEEHCESHDLHRRHHRRHRGKKSWHRKCAYDFGGFWEKCGIERCFHGMHCLSCGHHHDGPYNPCVAVEKTMPGSTDFLASPTVASSVEKGYKTHYDDYDDDYDDDRYDQSRTGRTKYRRTRNEEGGSGSSSGKSYSYSSSRSGSRSGSSESRRRSDRRRRNVGEGAQNLEKIGLAIDVRPFATTDRSFSIAAAVKNHIEAFASTFWNDEKEDAFRVTHDCDAHSTFAPAGEGTKYDDEDENEDDDDEEYEGETYFEKCILTEEGKVIPVLDGKNSCSFCSKALPDAVTKSNGAFQCDGCEMAVYCSVDCHDKDWKLGSHDERCCAQIKKTAMIAGGSSISCDVCSRREKKRARRLPNSTDRDFSPRDEEETELQGEDDAGEGDSVASRKSFFEAMAFGAVAHYVDSEFSLSDPLLSFIAANEKGKLRLRTPWTRKPKKKKSTSDGTVVKGSSIVTVPSGAGSTATATTTDGTAKPKKKSYFSRFKSKVKKVPGKIKKGFENRRMGYTSEETKRLKEEIANKKKTLKGHQAADLATKRRQDAERRQREAGVRLEKARAEEARLAVVRGSPSTAIVPGTTTTTVTTTTKTAPEELPSYMRGHIGAEWAASAMAACFSTLKKLNIDPRDVGFSIDDKKSIFGQGPKGGNASPQIAWNGGGPGAYPANPRYAGGGGIEYYHTMPPRVYSNPYANSYALRRPVVVTQSGTVRPYAGYYGRHPAMILPSRVARLHAAHEAMTRNYPKLANDPVWARRTNTIIKFWPFWWPWIFFITPPYYSSVVISDQMWENEEEMKRAIREIEEDERYRGFVQAGYRVVPNFNSDPPVFSWVAWSEESKRVAENALGSRNAGSQSREAQEWERSLKSQEGPPYYFDTGDY